jgi:hypothetical protein
MTQTKNSPKHNPIATNNSHTNQEVETRILQTESYNHQEHQKDRQNKKSGVPRRPFMQPLVWVSGI